MPTFSVAPHAQPGDDYTIAHRTGDFPPEPANKPIGKGKVGKDVTVDVGGRDGDYWVMVNGASIGVTVGGHNPENRVRAREKAQAQTDQDRLNERNRADKEHAMLEEPVDPKDQASENRPPNPEDQPNELPMKDNTGTTRNPTGGDVAKTGPVRRSKSKSKKA